ncbi:hypothetical protein GTW46_37385, partial [Streptomyces sp. SID6013]|nr:hypothetical protein [Streptomyces sp. SID6013]
CLPTMAGHHVLEVADLLTREAPPGAGHAPGLTRRAPGTADAAPVGTASAAGPPVRGADEATEVRT